MSKLSKFLFVLWIVLAIAAFVGAFWIAQPVLRGISIAFGIINMMIVMSWISATVKTIKENKKTIKTSETEEKS